MAMDPHHLVEELTQLESHVYDGIARSSGIVDRAATLLATLDGHDDFEFVRGLVLKFSAEGAWRCRQDTDILRVSSCGELYWQLSSWGSSSVAVSVGVIVGQRLLALGDVDLALRHLDRVIAMDPISTSQPQAVARCLRILALGNTQRFAEVVSELDAALAAMESGGMGARTSFIRVCGAEALSETGNQAAAETMLNSALALHDLAPIVEPGWPAALLPTATTASLYRTWAAIEAASGNLDRAIAILEDGRDRAKRERDASGAAFLLSEQGILWQRMGEHERSKAVLEQAAREAAWLGQDDRVLRWSGRLPADPKQAVLLSKPEMLSYATSLLAGHERADAIAENIALECLTWAEQNRLEDVELRARNLLANCFARRGALSRAIAMQRSAVERARALDQPLLALTFGINLAMYYVDSGQGPFAEAEAEAAIAIGETTRDESQTSELRQAVGSGLSRAYELLIEFASREVTLSAGRIRPPDAKRVLELDRRARTRSFDTWLALSNWGLEHPTSPTTELFRSLLRAEIRLEDAASRGASLREAFDRQRSARQALDTAIAADSGGFVRATVSDSPQHQPSTHLKPDTVAVNLSAVYGGVACTFVRTGIDPETIFLEWQRPDRDAWQEQWAEALRRATQGVARATINRSAWRMTEDSSDPIFATPPLASLCDALDRVLLAPITARLGDSVRRVVVIPHAELSALPYWGLTKTRANLAISIVPSLTSLDLFSERPLTKDGPWLKVGDATDTLLMVDRELEALQGFESVESSTLAVRTRLSGARRIHFAGHGLFSPNAPYTSGILLAGTSNPPLLLPSKYPGVVRMTIPGMIELLDLSNCELVVISACSTGKARVHAASEFTGVPAALMLKGARGVIAAAWPAHDGATALLMAEFYEALTTTDSPALALAHARSALKRLVRNEALQRLTLPDFVPPGDRPFEAPIYSDCFQYFGVA